MSGVYILQTKMKLTRQRGGSSKLSDMLIISEVDPATIGEYVKTVNGRHLYTGDQARDKVSGLEYTLEYIEQYMRFAWVRPGTVFAIIPDDRLELLGTIHDAKEATHADAE